MGMETALAAAALGSLGLTAYQVLAAPKVDIPVIRIPEEDLSRINQAIEANKALSDQARTTIQQAISSYNEGRLIPAYQAKLDEWWKQASKSLSQRLAAAGLQNSSIAQEAYNELASKYASLSADMLRTQLSDALSLSGLSQEHINELLSKAQLEIGAQQAYAQSYATAMPAAQQAQAMKGIGAGLITQSVLGLPSTLQKLGIMTAPATTTTTTAPVIEGAATYPTIGGTTTFGPELFGTL